MYQATEGANPQTCDQYTKLIVHAANKGAIHEQKSRAKEQACITGLVLAQPYLDFLGDDQAQGELKLKVWEFSSFLIDPYARDPGLSDANFIWCQEWISKAEAQKRFPDKINQITPMSGSPTAYGNFYFLPENYNLARSDLMILSYVWYKWKRKKKRLYSEQLNQFFDFSGGDENLQQILQAAPDIQEVTVEVPTWKLAVVLNDQLMFQGDNPLGFDNCPFVPYYWNYEPHMIYPELRARGLVRTMRDSNWLMSRQIVISHDQKEATINAGYKRKQGAVANEDNLKKTGQGWDVIINEGYEMTDFEKIEPNGVPQSDFELADRLRTLIFGTSGIDLENWSAQNDKQVSSLTTLLKQAANLTVLQKYFDQWDYSDKLLGDLLLQIPLNNWNAEKIGLMIGEEPTPEFYSKIFAKYHVQVEEADLTPTQQNLQAQNMLDMNQIFGREVFPPSMIIPKLNITGKGEIIQFLQQQEQQASAAQQEEMNLKHSVEEMKMKQLIAQIHNQLSQARERDSRSASNVGLFEERVSEISKNHALATKEKMEALTKLLEAIQKFGEVETFLQANNLESIKYDEEETEKKARSDIEKTEFSKQFIEQLMGQMPQGQGGQPHGQPPQQQQMMG